MRVCGDEPRMPHFETLLRTVPSSSLAIMLIALYVAANTIDGRFEPGESAVVVC